MMQLLRLVKVLARLLYGYLLFIPIAAHAHLAGITDTSIQIGYSKIKIIYTLPRDSIAELALPKPADDYASPEVLNHISQGFLVANNLKPCHLEQTEQRALNKVQSQQYRLLYDCGEVLGNLDIQYQLLVGRFPNHENFVRISMADKYISRVFSAQQSSVQLPVKQTLSKWGATLSDDFVDDPNQAFELSARPDYFPMGVEHILMGFDHLLFLFALLLLPLSFKQLLAMITAFTVAHSITLALAVFDVISLPVLWVEAVIALSIVYVGVENLYELKGVSVENLNTPWRRRVMTTFLFGLIHGVGFSYVLKEIGLGDQVAGALLFFNLGVEVGQLLAVLVVLPLLAIVFKRWPNLLLSKICSVLVIGVGGLWMVERVLTAIGS